VTDTAKIVARILRRRKGRKLRIHAEKLILGIEDQKDAEIDITKNCDTYVKLCACFIDWQKAFDSLNGPD
jgi:hypothetical protein